MRKGTEKKPAITIRPEALQRFRELLTESVRLRSQNRDQAGNRFTFEIELKLKGGKPASAAKPVRAPKP